MIRFSKAFIFVVVELSKPIEVLACSTEDHQSVKTVASKALAILVIIILIKNRS